MTYLNDAQVEGVLTGMPYPARLWKIVAWAEFNGACPAILNPLYTIPDRDYSCAHEIVAAICAGGEQTSAAHTCHHRRHPRLCTARRDFTGPLAS